MFQRVLRLTFLKLLTLEIIFVVTNTELYSSFLPLFEQEKSKGNILLINIGLLFLFHRRTVVFSVK